MNRRKNMINTRHTNTNDPQKKYRIGTISKKNILLEGLNPFHMAMCSEQLVPQEQHLFKGMSNYSKEHSYFDLNILINF